MNMSQKLRISLINCDKNYQLLAKSIIELAGDCIFKWKKTIPAKLDDDVYFIRLSKIDNNKIKALQSKAITSNAMLVLIIDTEICNPTIFIDTGFFAILENEADKQELKNLMARICKRKTFLNENNNALEISREFFVKHDIVKLTTVPKTEAELNKKYGLRLKKGCYRAVLVKYDKTCDIMSVFEDKTIRQLLRDVIENLLSELCYDIIFDMMGDGVLAILNYKKSDSTYIDKKIKAILHDANLALIERKDISLTLCISREYLSVMKLPDIKFEAIDAKWSRMANRKSKVIKAEDSHQDIDIKIKSYLKWLMNNLLHAFETFNKEKCAECINEIFSFDSNILKSREIRLFIRDLYQKLLKTYADITSSAIDFEETHHNMMFKMNMAGSFKNIADSFINEIYEMIDRMKTNIEREHTNSIDKAIKMIKAEPFDVTLKYVADYLSLTPTYFSTLFHKQTGIKFYEFVVQCRIDLAKRQLISDSEKNISEIAVNLHFSSVQAFSKFFSKYAGITPLKFRNGIYTNSVIANKPS